MVAPLVVALPLPTFGHINPLLHLSVQLASMGTRVSFIATSNTVQRVCATLESCLEAEQLDAAKIQANLSIEVLNVEEGSLENLNQGGLPGLWANMLFMSEQAENVENLIRSKQQDGQLTCMIVDFFLVSSFKPLISKIDVPFATMWVCSITYMRILLELPYLLSQGYIPIDHAKVPPFKISGIPGLPELWSDKDLPSDVSKPDKNDPGYSFSLGLMNAIRESKWVIVPTFEELDHEVLRSLEDLQLQTKVVPIRPLLLVGKCERKSKESQLFEWLDAKPALSVVYVSFGSVAQISTEQLQELASALETSGYFFVWVIRDDQKTDNFKLKTASKGMVVPWCSQSRVLQHPSVGGFVTHCGWNAVLEGIECGTPMIGWPCLAEQYLTSKFLVDVWKVGIRILVDNEASPGVVVPARLIVEHINTIMTSDVLRNQCQLWKEKAKKQSFQNVHALHQEFQTISLQKNC